MAQGTANPRAIPGVLAEALQATLALNPSTEGQKTAQRDIATALQTALDARRQRIIISESQAAHDGQIADTLLNQLGPHTIVLADKAYDADRIRQLIQDHGATPNIPPKSNRR